MAEEKRAPLVELLPEDKELILPWQPPRWYGLKDRMVFGIKVMTGDERRSWIRRLRNTGIELVGKNITLRESTEDKVENEMRLEFVKWIDNVPDGQGGRYTARQGKDILRVLKRLTAEDDQALDHALFNISGLEVGLVKNFKPSPTPSTTIKAESGTDAVPAES